MAGIRYKGQIFSGAAAFGTADHVAYDNTESGLSATDVQGALDELGTDKVSFKIISSGSLHDIRETGIFYLTSTVTDKPASEGGFYVVTAYNPDLIVGEFISIYHYVASVVYVNGVWSSVSNSIRNTTISDTTSATGAFTIPSSLRTKRILEVYPTTYSGLVFRRDGGYFTCLDNNANSPIASTSVTLSVTYLD